VSYKEQMQRIANDYVRSGEPWPATTMEIAAWAVRKGLWEPQRKCIIAQCAHHLSDAMRQEFVTDPQETTVRAKHAARLKGEDGKQLVIWADIRSAPRKHMEIAMKQRRQQILGDCRQLKVDSDSYNENKNPGRPINLVFDFTRDIEELEQGSASNRPTYTPRPRAVRPVPRPVAYPRVNS